MIYLVPCVGSLVCWLVSLRRTPYAAVWFFVSVFFAVLGCVEIAGAEAVRRLGSR